VTPEARRPRGKTHTIAELLDDGIRDGSAATIVATVHSLRGNVDGYGLLGSDGTGSMRLRSPATAHTVTSPSVFARFEFDIVIHREPGPNDLPANEPNAQEVLDARRRAWAGPAHAIVISTRFIESVPSA
jgi:hypothetical protein